MSASKLSDQNINILTQSSEEEFEEEFSASYVHETDAYLSHQIDTISNGSNDAESGGIMNEIEFLNLIPANSYFH